MITIEVIKSSNHSALGVYEYAYDLLHVGRSLKNDLIFSDKQLPLKYLVLKIIEENGQPGMIVKSQGAGPYFFVNGKKVSGTLKIRQGDQITFGENRLQIVKFERTHHEQDLSEIYQRLEKSAPELKFALEFIEEVLIDLEK